MGVPDWRRAPEGRVGSLDHEDSWLLEGQWRKDTRPRHERGQLRADRRRAMVPMAEGTRPRHERGQ